MPASPMQKLRLAAAVAILAVAGLGAQTAQAPWPPAGVLTLPSPGVVGPVPIERSNPTYTRDGMLAKIQGVVLLSCVIEADGSVGEVRVVRSLDRAYGLDDQAIAAAKRWRFRPATRDGVAVRVLVPISIGFNLKGEPPPSTWPALFPGANDPADDPDWDEAKASGASISARVPHPKTWRVVEGRPGRLVAIMSPDSRYFIDIGQPGPLPKPLPLPFPVGQLRQASESLAKAIGAHDFSPIDSGQARAGDRWWLWQDHAMPPSAASRLPPEVRDALTAQFDSLRLWTFITSVETHAVIVFFWALVPAGLTPADAERDLRATTIVFDRMIKRMVLQ